jgi:hypothetical protein
MRAFLQGMCLVVILAALNAWIETRHSVHFLGGIQMPFGAVFILLFLLIGITFPFRFLCRRVPTLQHVFPPFSRVELLTVYTMAVFAALISTPGADNFFLTIGPALFYYSTAENRWADLFYQHLPSHFAPGWDGVKYQRQVIEPFFTGGISPSDIPWHAWTAMLTAWSILVLLIYSALFFSALLLRRQWIENEALAFPLSQLPLHMVETGDPPSHGGFWSDKRMWGGFTLAAALHLLRGLNNYYPDWPLVSCFQGNAYRITFTERPWDAAGSIGIEFFLGGIGIAYLLTREVSFSFWFFFLFFKLQLVFATTIGYPAESLPQDGYFGRPAFMTWQSAGGWLTIGLLLLWTARLHLLDMARETLFPSREYSKFLNEPFTPRTVLIGLLCSCAGILAWSWYSGISLLPIWLFFTIYALVALVVARLVIEGGLIYPQATFSALEVMSRGFPGSAALGASDLTRLSFLQANMMTDLHANLLPGFLHTLKIAHELKLDRPNTRRLLFATVCAILLAFLVSVFTHIATIYAQGGLASDRWFLHNGPHRIFKGTESLLREQPSIDGTNLFWMGVGSTAVWLMMLARSRYLWFPLHPLGYIMGYSGPLIKLWPSFFVGWLVKVLIMRFGDRGSLHMVRTFMLGLILGNAAAMVAWMIFGFFSGSQIPYWPA